MTKIQKKLNFNESKQIIKILASKHHVFVFNHFNHWDTYMEKEFTKKLRIQNLKYIFAKTNILKKIINQSLLVNLLNGPSLITYGLSINKLLELKSKEILPLFIYYQNNLYKINYITKMLNYTNFNVLTIYQHHLINFISFFNYFFLNLKQFQK